MNSQDILDKKISVGVVGLGYVGLPLIREFTASGYKTIGFDIDEKKVTALNKGQSYIAHIPSKLIKDLRAKKVFRATNKFNELKKVDVILICVPTPLDGYRNPDLSSVINTTELIAKNLKKGHLIILESTTYPGTTAEELKPRLESTGLKSGKDFYLAYSPEREDPGNPQFSTKMIPKVLGADDATSRKLATHLYEQIIEKVHVVNSTRAAEATKILENIYRCVNIAMINEMKMIFDSMDIDIWEVIDAAATKPFGFQKFTPGPGLGGHCIPIDPFYLSWKARENNQAARFIELAGEINCSMPTWVIDKLMRALNQQSKPLKGSKILVLGMAYKPNVDDDRESPSRELIETLIHHGAKVSYHDPYIPKFKGSREYTFQMNSLPLSEKNLKAQDAVLISTNHDCIDYQFVVNHSKLVLDTRNATENVKHHRKRIFKA